MKRTMHGPMIPLVAAAIAATSVCAQAPYSLDTSFNTQIQSKWVNDVVVLNSGGLLLSGAIKFPGDVSFRGSARLLPDGSRDLTFPNFPLTTGGGRITPWNGKYYVTTGLVHRLDSAGVVDPSFFHENNGAYVNGGGGGDYFAFPDGSILATGPFVLEDTVRGFVGNYDLVWFTNTGYLDTTKTHRQGNSTVGRIKQTPDGGFVCSGNSTTFEGHAIDWIFKVDADGFPDTTFRTHVFGGLAQDFLSLSDGRVYAGGEFWLVGAPLDTLHLVRFLPDGSMDPVFTMPYFTDGDLNGPVVGALISRIIPWSTDRLIVLGYFQFVNGEPRRGICMLDTTGQLMPEFDGCGVDSFPVGSLDYAHVQNLVVDSAEGYIYLCGAYIHYNDGSYFDPAQRFVTRLFLGSPSTQITQAGEGNAGIRVYPNPGSNSARLEWSLPHVSTSKGTATLSIVDAQSRVVRREELDLSRGAHEMDVSTLAPGLYHLHMVQDGTWITGGKLVVE